MCSFSYFFLNSFCCPSPFSLSVALQAAFHASGEAGHTLIHLRGSAGKESACNAGDLGSIPELGRSPGGGHGKPPQYSCLENPHGQRSLAGYSPWGRKESDTTERVSTQAEGTALSLAPTPYCLGERRGGG